MNRADPCFQSLQGPDGNEVLRREYAQLHTDMLRIRIAEQVIAAHYPEQQMRCPVHLCIGQEAIAVGVCSGLTQDDYVFSNHRAHGHYLAKGGSLRKLIAELYGQATGCAGGKGGSMHLVDQAVGFLGATPIVGATIPIAVGAAFGEKMAGTPRLTVVFFGEGATEEGVFCESLNFAALQNLPIVFVCENNQYSVYSPLSVRQPADRDLGLIARGHGLAYAHGDGNDVLEVCEIAGAAIQDARSDLGPSVLEFDTYRWLEHCGPYDDDHLHYRPEADVAYWKARCPIARLGEKMVADGTASPGDLERMREELTQEIEAVLAGVRKEHAPAADELLSYVYASGVA